MNTAVPFVPSYCHDYFFYIIAKSVSIEAFFYSMKKKTYFWLALKRKNANFLNISNCITMTDVFETCDSCESITTRVLKCWCTFRPQGYSQAYSSPLLSRHTLIHIFSLIQILKNREKLIFSWKFDFDFFIHFEHLNLLLTYVYCFVT